MAAEKEADYFLASLVLELRKIYREGHSPHRKPKTIDEWEEETEWIDERLKELGRGLARNGMRKV